MKTSFCNVFLMVFAAMVSSIGAQTLQPSWSYSYDETEAGKQIFSTTMNSGSDGSIAIVVNRSDGGGGPSQNQIFWLRANDDGTSPTTPLWTSGWLASNDYPSVVAVRKNHLVYATGSVLKSVTVDGAGVATESLVKTFSGVEEGGTLEFSLELARAPGFVYATSIHSDSKGFKLNAFKFTPAIPQVSEVATITSVSGNSLSISFRSQLGVNYQLQSSTTLESNSWQDVGSPVAGNGATQTFNQTIAVPKLFFRIVAL
ncbi:hypothetical protein HW115_09645 [Verrucomicrobiaceae bacterium N1E253]|uniref:Uncharacterized protein n=1 Tax=Oceaniferula marina TaxID=2748318 RepID=A0A851GP08_9BACT|nr:hypothetical protein [Oceaniferula marina]NWK55874.1 hypothetical protein [Oceaniferula marina]